MSVPGSSSDTNDAILGLLRNTAQSYEQSKNARVQAAKAARELGFTYAQIADAYGVSLSAVNMMIRRSEGL